MADTLFVVEDDPGNRLTLVAILEDEGFKVQEASSKAAAEAFLRGGETVDAVLLDQTLGDGFGTELVPLVREKHPKALVVLLSGSDHPEDAKRLGMDGAIVKAGAPSALVDTLRRLLDAKRALAKSSPSDAPARRDSADREAARLAAIREAMAELRAEYACVLPQLLSDLQAAFTAAGYTSGPIR